MSTATEKPTTTKPASVCASTTTTESADASGSSIVVVPPATISSTDDDDDSTCILDSCFGLLEQHVLPFLNVDDLIQRTSLVSKRWKEASRQDSIWKPLVSKHRFGSGVQGVVDGKGKGGRFELDYENNKLKTTTTTEDGDDAVDQSSNNNTDKYLFWKSYLSKETLMKLCENNDDVLRNLMMNHPWIRQSILDSISHTYCFDDDDEDEFDDDDDDSFLSDTAASTDSPHPNNNNNTIPMLDAHLKTLIRRYRQSWKRLKKQQKANRRSGTAFFLLQDDDDDDDFFDDFDDDDDDDYCYYDDDYEEEEEIPLHVLEQPLSTSELIELYHKCVLYQQPSSSSSSSNSTPPEPEEDDSSSSPSSVLLYNNLWFGIYASMQHDLYHRGGGNTTGAQNQMNMNMMYRSEITSPMGFDMYFKVREEEFWAEDEPDEHGDELIPYDDFEQGVRLYHHSICYFEPDGDLAMEMKQQASSAQQGGENHTYEQEQEQLSYHSTMLKWHILKTRNNQQQYQQIQVGRYPPLLAKRESDGGWKLENVHVVLMMRRERYSIYNNTTSNNTVAAAGDDEETEQEEQQDTTVPL